MDKVFFNYREKNVSKVDQHQSLFLVKNSKKTKVEKLVNISISSAVQRAALRHRKTSECPVTPLGRATKKRKK